MMNTSADWSRYSASKLRCIDALSFPVMMHQTYLCRTFKVRTNTIGSLIDDGVVERLWLTEDGYSTPMPFYRLTRLGQAVQRDWRRWCNSVATKVTAAIPGGMTATALEARLRSTNG